ncbi:MAG: replicative DNA helicase [Alphaproteobacteria bacterium]|nr:replicative DNA helicase [Alphaproteobacteria bacterium]
MATRLTDPNLENLALERAEGLTLPHNLELEQALLGALLIDNEVANRLSFLAGPHFFDPLHERIYDTAARLIDRGQLASPATIKTYMENDEGLKEVGGAQYLARLVAAASSAHHAEEYGRTIYDLHLRRELIRISDEAAGRASQPETEENATHQIERVEDALFSLAESGQTESGFQPFSASIATAVESIEAAINREGQLTGVSTGLTRMDELLGGLHRSDLVILAGRPSMGKTALATNIAFHAAREFKRAKDEGIDPEQAGGAVVGFFSLEMSAEQLAGRMLAEQSGIPSDQLRRGMLNQDQFQGVARASQEIEDIPFFIDDTPALTISAILSRARRLKRRHNLGLVVVDYLQLLRPSGRNRVDNRVQEISEITQGLKALAKNLNVPVLALSQLSRSVEQREDKRPLLSDLRESGSIEQDADVVMFVYREEYYHERREPEHGTEDHLKWQEKGERIHGVAEVIIGKQRHGPTGTARLHFNRETTKFGNLVDSDHLPDQIG